MPILAMFDFDGTLFRSPTPPPWYERGWYADALSLSPPCVPLRPGSQWWVGSVLQEARKAIADPTTFAIICTGRIDKLFRWRIPEILRSANLDFDEVHLNPGTLESTGIFKRKVLQSTLRKFPFISRVELWDDQHDLLQSYVHMLRRAGYEVIPHPVRSKPAEVNCEPQDLEQFPDAKQAVYVGLVLDNPETLLHWWAQNVESILPTTLANHMTMKFRPTSEELESLPIGAKAHVRVTGIASDGSLQVVSVDPGGLPVDNDVPHITVATESANPKEANRLLARGLRKVEGPVLSGTVGISNGQRFYFTLGPSSVRVATQYLEAKEHKRSIALMKFLSSVARDAGISKHVYVVGGAVRDFVLRKPIKDIDVVIDSVRAGMDSGDFAKLVSRKIPTPTSLTTNQYGVAILSVKGDWELEGENLQGEVIEVANARTESYGKGEGGKGYKPTEVSRATIEDDVRRREFTWNSLMWRLFDLVDGPEKAEIIDLTGCGLRDLQERRMQCPADPNQTFSDDPSRILRAIKFIGRYGFKMTPATEAALRKHAPKMKRMPYEAIANILVHNILTQANASRMLGLMDELGILKVISEMIQENQGFSAYLSRELSSPQYRSLLLDILDRGVPVRTPLSFLTPPQRNQVRNILVSMTKDEADAYLEKLQKPPVDNMKVIEMLGLNARERGRIAPLARGILINSPDLTSKELTEQVIQQW